MVYKEGSLPMKTVTALSEEQQQQNEELVLTRTTGDLQRTHLAEQEKEQTADKEGVFRLTQWWCQRQGVWHNYSDVDNRNLEDAYYPPRNAQVTVCMGTAVVNIVSKTERSNEGAVYPMLRTRWHVQRSDGTLIPFSHQENTALETAFVVNPMECVDEYDFDLILRAMRAKPTNEDFRVPAIPFLDYHTNPIAWKWMGSKLQLMDTSHPEEGLHSLLQVLEALAGF